MSEQSPFALENDAEQFFQRHDRRDRRGCELEDGLFCHRREAHGTHHLETIVNQHAILTRQQRPNLTRVSGLFFALFEAEGIVTGFEDVTVVSQAVE